MIDLHCHYLPGIDDGARTMQEALALAAAAVGNGIAHAVLTPHVHPGYFDNSLSTLLPGFVAFQASLQAAGIDLEVSLGGEVRLHPDVFELLAADDLPSIGQSDGYRVVLLELPDGNIPPGAMEACRLFMDRGIRPMIAHPERNKDVMRDPQRIRPFVDAGCLLQITAASVIGRFGPQALQATHQLLAAGVVSVVATDAHNLSHRPPLLREAREAIAKLYGLGMAHRLTVETPEAIVCGRMAAKLKPTS